MLAAFKAAPPEPSRGISAPTRRWLIAVMFALAALWKLSIRRSFHTFALIDFGALFVTYISRTPWLKFSGQVYLAAFAAMCVLDAAWCDFSLLQYPGLIVSVLLGQELTITGTRERPTTHEMLAKQHLPQAYTVNYLPESTALLTADESLCLDSELPVYFHLTLNNTVPKNFKLLGQGFGGQEFVVEFDQRALNRVLSTKNNTVRHYFLPISAPGSYQLAEVVDKSGERVQISSELIIVPPCPNALFTDPSPPQVCVGAETKAEIQVTGMAPFELVLSDKSSMVIGQAEQHPALQTVAVPVNIDTRTAGKKTLELVSVKDALNNWSNLSASASIDVILPPSLRIDGPTEIPLLDRQTTVQLAIGGVDLPCSLSYSDPAGAHHTAVLTSSSPKLELSMEGVYILEKFHGSLCSSGSIEGPKAVRVFVPPMVQATVEFEQLKDKCSGPTGINADVKLEGTPPFTVWYETLQRGRVIDKNSITTSDPTAKVLFKPHSVGTFKYQFVAVKDAYRRVELHDATEQVIQEVSGASFAPNMQTSYCPSQPVKIDTHIQGKGPITLNYLVDGKKYSVDNAGEKTVLDIGVLKGGDHEVVLSSVVDENGCTTPVNVRSPKISVRKDKTSVKFSGPRKIKAYSAEMVLPLQLSHSGSSSVKVKYSLNGVNHTQVAGPSGLQVNAPGTYKLLEADDGCPGLVGSEEVQITLYERPTVELIENEPEVCSDGFSHTILQFKGEPPFKLWSETVDPHGKSSFEEHTTPNTKIKLPTKPRDLPGLYRTYYWVTDKLYPDSDRSRGALIVDQRVLTAPVVMHQSPGASYDLCQAPGSQKGVPILVQGSGPFTLNYQLQDLETGRTQLHKAQINQSGVFYLSEPFQKFAGSAQVRLTSIKDSRGCTGHAIASKATVKVKSTIAPTLEIPSRNVCVGNHVHVNLEGEGPFSMSYKLNGHKRSVRTHKNFNFLATKPGTMQILSLDDTLRCPAVLDEQITIHDLPSCRITRPPSFNMRPGDDAVELQFAFSGTPPFTFEYTRTVNGKRVETHRVEGVEGHEHSIFTKEQGQYNIVSLADAHCSISI